MSDEIQTVEEVVTSATMEDWVYTETTEEVTPVTSDDVVEVPAVEESEVVSE